MLHKIPNHEITEYLIIFIYIIMNLSFSDNRAIIRKNLEQQQQQQQKPK